MAGDEEDIPRPAEGEDPRDEGATGGGRGRGEEEGEGVCGEVSG